MLKRLFSLIFLGFASLAQAGVAIEHWQTPAGMRVYFVASHELPMLDVQLDFAAGSMFDPPGKAGLASLTHALIDLGADGADETEISNRMADVGANLGGGLDADRASIRLRTLSHPEKEEAALVVLEKVLRAPHFDAAIFERERARNVAALKDALTQPATLAQRAFWSAIYPQHPYGQLSTPESLGAIQHEELRAFWQSHYNVGNATLTIVGDISLPAAKALALRLAAALPTGGAPAALPAPPITPTGGAVLLVYPASQAHIAVGMPAIARGDPDYFPLLVGNYTLGGGGFVSRLMREVREKRGFAYSVYSYFAPMKQNGPFEIGLQTKKEQANEALEVVRQVLREFLAQGPTPAELKAAKDNLVGSFPLRLDSNSKILDHVAMIGFYGLPLDYLETYQARVQAVSAEDIRRAFVRHVRPENLVTVTVATP
jgi:zinc protease